MNPTRAEKYAEITRLRGLGWTNLEIADALGMSLGGIAGILNDPDGAKQRERRERYRGTCRECGAKTDGSSGYNAPSLCIHCSGRAQRIWTKEIVTEAIQRWAREFGRPPTSSEWHHADHTWGHPAATAIYGESGAFPNWADAVEAAGFPRPSVGRNPGELQWNQERIIAAIQRWVSETGAPPKMREWEKAPDPAFPTNSTVIAYFGYWNEAMVAAGFEPRNGRSRLSRL